MITTILLTLLGGVGLCYLIATLYVDKQFYNRVQRRQDLIRRYTSED